MYLDKRSFILAASLILSAGAAFPQAAPAETPKENKQDGRKHDGARGGQRMAEALNLTDAQKEQIRSITKEAFASNQALRTQLKAAHEAEQAAIKAGKSDAELVQLAQNSAPLHAQVHAARLQTEAKIFKVLTPEQQAKLAEIRAHMKERMGRFARRHVEQQ